MTRELPLDFLVGNFTAVLAVVAVVAVGTEELLMCRLMISLAVIPVEDNFGSFEEASADLLAPELEAREVLASNTPNDVSLSDVSLMVMARGS